jgi:hypothetical protein
MTITAVNAKNVKLLRDELRDLSARLAFSRKARGTLNKQVHDLREMRNRDLKTYQAHLDVCRIERDKALAYVAELQGRLKVMMGKGKAHGKPEAIDSPRIWAALNTRDSQWRDSICALNMELGRVQGAMMDVFNNGPMPPIARTPPDAVAAIYHQVPDPADGNVKLERITRDPRADELREMEKQGEQNLAHTLKRLERDKRVAKARGRRMADEVLAEEKVDKKGIVTPVPGGNGVWFRKRKSKSKGK